MGSGFSSALASHELRAELPNPTKAKKVWCHCLDVTAFITLRCLTVQQGGQMPMLVILLVSLPARTSMDTQERWHSLCRQGSG